METRKIKISDIELNEDRNEGGKGDIESLAKNLEKYGQINAVTVVKAGAESDYIFRIIAGRRRVTAAKSLGWEEIRADVYEADEISAESEEMIALSENAAREEMNAIDEGILYANELKKGTPVEELAALFCRNKKTVYQRAKLASLIPEMRELFKAEKLPLHIAAMAAELPEEAQKKCADKCKEKTWGTLSEWEVKAIVSEVSEDYVNKLGDCKSCENCPKRTRYSDKTLFPELAETCDRCLDHGCFLKNYKEFIENEFEKFNKKNGGAKYNRVVTSEKIPDNFDLNFKIEEISEDEENLTDITPEEDTGIKAKLEALKKVEFVPCWNGKSFEVVELAKVKDIKLVYEDKEEKKEPSAWELSQLKEIEDVCRCLSDEKKKPVLENYSNWWELRRKINDSFEKKLKEAVFTDSDDKILDKEQIALIVLLNCQINELKELPGFDKDIKPYSFDEFEKLLKVNRGLLLRTILKSLLSGYRAKPGISNVEESEWQRIFERLDIDLAAIRDNSVREVLGITEENSKKSEEDFDEDIEKFGVIDDNID